MSKYKLTATRVYWWPVTVSFPHPDPQRAGQVVEQTFRAKFRETPRAEAIALVEQISALPRDQQEQRQFDLVKSATVGWSEDVVDDDEQPIPFSAARLEEAMQSSYFRLGLVRAHVESMTGEAARLGNSAPSPAPGREATAET